MHAAARDFVASVLPTTTDYSVVEVGALDINGGVRDLLPGSNWYGIDVVPGPGVDEVADGATWQPSWDVDIAVCCEVLEHAENWADIVHNMASWLPPGGLLILTAAGPGRAPHSAVDGGILRVGEYYGNIDPNELVPVLRQAHIVSQTDVGHGDVYAWGTKFYR